MRVTVMSLSEQTKITLGLYYVQTAMAGSKARVKGVKARLNALIKPLWKELGDYRRAHVAGKVIYVVPSTLIDRIDEALREAQRHLQNEDDFHTRNSMQIIRRDALGAVQVAREILTDVSEITLHI